jgi:hypothetical protein
MGGSRVKGFELQPQYENFVIIRTFASIAEARVMQGTLESFGIESHLSDEATIGLDWSYSAALGGVKLMVRGEDAIWALHYLQQNPEPIHDSPEIAYIEEEFTLPRCPSCDSDRVYPIERKKKIGVVLLFATVLGVPFATGAIAAGMVAIPLVLGAMFSTSSRDLLVSSFECRECSNRF